MIYVIQNQLDNKIYIGKTIKTLEERFYKHCKEAEYGSQRYLYRAMRKHGIENFKISQLEQCDECDDNERERFWIAGLNPEYNMTAGGDGGWINDQTGNTWTVKDSSKMGRHKNQWMNENDTRRKDLSKRMTYQNPSKLFPRTEKQLAASRRQSVHATEASKKPVGYIDISTNKEYTFESKRALIKHLGISYDVLNYRLKTGILYQTYKFFESNKNGNIK